MKEKAQNLKNGPSMDSELFVEVLKWYGSLDPTDEDLASAAGLAEWIIRGVSDVCDVSAPRLATPRSRTAAYWWNEVVEACRKTTIAARRQLTRCRRKGTDEEIAARKQVYKEAKKNLQSEIKKAKKNAWYELIHTIDGDPWDLPYKVVMNKLRIAGPGLSEKLSNHVLQRLLDSLFPSVASTASAAEVA